MANIMISLGLALFASSIFALATETSIELDRLIYKTPCKPNCLEPEQTYEKLTQLAAQLVAENSQAAKVLVVLETTQRMIEIHDEKAEKCKGGRLLSLCLELLYKHGGGVHSSPVLNAPPGSIEAQHSHLSTGVSNAARYAQFHKERQFKFCGQIIKDLVESKMQQETNHQIFSLRSLAEAIRKATQEGKDQWTQFVKGAVEFWSSKENIVFGSRKEFKKKKEAEYLPKVRNLIYGVCDYLSRTFGNVLEFYHKSLELDKHTATFIRVASGCNDVLSKRERFEADFFEEAQKRCTNKGGFLKSCFTGSS